MRQLMDSPVFLIIMGVFLVGLIILLFFVRKVGTTGWAMTFCLMGVTTVFLSWVDISAGGNIPDQVAYYAGGNYNGFFTWHGFTTGITFFVLFLLLVATSPFDPVPLWRSILLFLAASAIVVFTSLFIGRFVNQPFVKIREGAYSALGLGLSLIVLATLEIRGMILRQLKNRKLAFMVPLEVKEIIPREVKEVHKEKKVSEKEEEMPAAEKADWLKESGGIQDKPPRPKEEFGPPV
jgi:hypothetical protein